MTNELLSDSDNNIVGVAQEWLADEARVTANKEILDVITGQTARDLKDLDGILAESRPYTLEDWNKRSWFRRICASVFRLGSIWL